MPDWSIKTAAPASCRRRRAALAQVTQAVATATPADPRLAIMRGGVAWPSDRARLGQLQTPHRRRCRRWPRPGNRPQRAGGRRHHAAGPAGSRVSLDRAHPLLQARTYRRRARCTCRRRPGWWCWRARTMCPTPPGAQASGGSAWLRADPQPVPRAACCDGAMHPPMARIKPGVGRPGASRGGRCDRGSWTRSSPPRTAAQVALRLPIAAGLEPLNPALANATAEAAPSAGPTLAPSWASYGDDEMVAVWQQPAPAAPIRCAPACAPPCPAATPSRPAPRRCCTNPASTPRRLGSGSSSPGETGGGPGARRRAQPCFVARGGRRTRIWTHPPPTAVVTDANGIFITQAGHATLRPGGGRQVEYGYWPVIATAAGGPRHHRAGGSPLLERIPASTRSPCCGRSWQHLLRAGVAPAHRRSRCRSPACSTRARARCGPRRSRPARRWPSPRATAGRRCWRNTSGWRRMAKAATASRTRPGGISTSRRRT